jgi:hypothetical protein
MLVVLGFTVEIAGSGTGTDTDSAWETCSGGELNIEVCDSSVGTSQYHATTPGHKYVGSLTLRGPMTSGRKDMCTWITDTLEGKEWKRAVTIKEILKDGTDGKQFTYIDCFPTRYVFPALSASGTGNLYEELTMKPIRLDLA